MLRQFIAFLLLFASLTAAADTAPNRIDQISGQFIGVPYAGSPLGEGEGSTPDADPLLRYDAFDCTTFIETVMAIHFAGLNSKATPSDADILDWMNFIRYKNANISFFNRNHFTSADWIPHLLRYDLVTDVTYSLFPNDAKTLVTQIDRIAWFKKVHNIDFHGSNTTSYLPYVPKNLLLENPELIDRIPNASIINFARDGWNVAELIDTDLAVSHQGLLIRKNGVAYFRHASSAKSVMKVTEEPLIDYLRKLADNDTHIGINILKITE